MTCEQIEPGQWRLAFSEPETEFILNILARLGRHYQEDITRLPPALRAYWQGTMTRSDVAPTSEVREIQGDLAEARAELRSERLALVENWMREYEISEQHDPWRVDLTSAERDEFLAMLNDRRMMLALEMGITEDDMEADLGQVANDSRRAGILEIDLLGHWILIMLGPQIYRP
jgi:hypothetical protein